MRVIVHVQYALSVSTPFMVLGQVMFEKQLILVKDFCNRETSAAVRSPGRSLNQLLTNEHVGDSHDAGSSATFKRRVGGS